MRIDSYFEFRYESFVLCSTPFFLLLKSLWDKNKRKKNNIYIYIEICNDNKCFEWVWKITQWGNTQQCSIPDDNNNIRTRPRFNAKDRGINLFGTHAQRCQFQKLYIIHYYLKYYNKSNVYTYCFSLATVVFLSPAEEYKIVSVIIIYNTVGPELGGRFFTRPCE